MCIAFRLDVDDGIFKHGQIRLAGDDRLHPCGVFPLGALRARRPHGWTAREVQRLDLQRRRVGVLAHFATERVEFVDEVAFGKAADRRIARHLRDGGCLGGHKKGACAHPRGGEGGFAPGMAAADHNHVI